MIRTDYHHSKFEIMAYPKRHSISRTFNRHRLQGLTSNFCGHYCCLYALHRARGLSIMPFVNMFINARYNCIDKRAEGMFRSQFGFFSACCSLEEQQTANQKYTWCPSRNVRDFVRVFLMLKYTNINLHSMLKGYGDNGQRILKL